MKNKYVLNSLAIVSLFIIITAGTEGIATDTGGTHGTLESGGMWSNTGSPGDGNTCAECHTSGGVSVDNSWISTNIPGTEYVPDSTYTITLTGTYPPGGTNKGFSIVCEDNSNVPVGTFTITDATNTALFNNHVSHKSAGTSLNSWSCSWTAPATGTGNVTFYAAFLKDGYDGGVVTASSLYTGGPTFIQKVHSQPIFSLYPNPVSDLLHLELSDISDVSVSIFSITGQKVLSDIVVGSGILFSKTYDLTALDGGTYFVKVSSEDKIYTKKIIVN